jgi:hypothetical protein
MHFPWMCIDNIFFFEKMICIETLPKVFLKPVGRVDGRGDLCTFYELPTLKESSISYMSAFNESWFLGFRRHEWTEDGTLALRPIGMSG